jgi:hypothetical protein
MLVAGDPGVRRQQSKEQCQVPDVNLEERPGMASAWDTNQRCESDPRCRREGRPSQCGGNGASAQVALP